MDELTMLGTALGGTDPSPDAVARSRHRLQNVMRGGPATPGRKKRRIVVGAGLLTAAVAAVGCAHLRVRREGRLPGAER